RLRLRELTLEAHQVARGALQEPRRVEQVADAEPGARRLVAIREADAAAGGADRALSGLRDTLGLEVVGQNQMSGSADSQARAHIDAQRLDALRFLAQPLQVDHYAVADQTALAGRQDARGQQLEDHRAALVDHAVAGVGSALVTRDE